MASAKTRITNCGRQINAEKPLLVWAVSPSISNYHNQPNIIINNSPSGGRASDLGKVVDSSPTNCHPEKAMNLGVIVRVLRRCLAVFIIYAVTEEYISKAPYVNGVSSTCTRIPSSSMHRNRCDTACQTSKSCQFIRWKEPPARRRGQWSFQSYRKVSDIFCTKFMGSITPQLFERASEEHGKKLTTYHDICTLHFSLF